MIRVNIVCEGKTECEFVKSILAPHLINFQVIATPHDLGTGTNYARLKAKTLDWLKAESDSYVTTLVDLYAMPNDFPGQDIAKGKHGKQKIDILEEAFAKSMSKIPPIGCERQI
jgi:Domain of unknown function (DUF4276)